MLKSSAKQNVLNENQRNKLIGEYLSLNVIQNRNVRSAIQSINRYLFLPDNKLSLAYMDAPIDIINNRKLIDIATLGFMLSVAEINKNHNIMVLGSSVGYTAAVVSRLCKTVFAVDNDEKLSQIAYNITNNLGISNITYVNSTLDNPKELISNPIDIIILDGACEVFLKSWEGIMEENSSFIYVLRERNYSRVIKAVKVNGNIIKYDYNKQVPMLVLDDLLLNKFIF